MAPIAEKPIDISHIKGNAPDDVKRLLASSYKIFKGKEDMGNLFGEEIHKRMVVTEVSVVPKAEEPKKKEGRVVVEMEVFEGEERVSTWDGILTYWCLGRYVEWGRKYSWRMLGLFD